MSVASTTHRRAPHARRAARQAVASAVVCAHRASRCTLTKTNCHSKTTNRFHHRNQQYSVIALTNGSGAIAERYAYSAYGEPVFTNASGTVLSDSAKNNRYTYTGREWDEELSLFHFRARMYDAVSGRFCGRDPIGYVSPSLYEYVLANPLYYVDPSGFKGEPPVSVPIPPGRPKKPHQPTDPLKPMWPVPQNKPEDPWQPEPYSAPRTPRTICDSMKGFTACANCIPGCEQTIQDLLDAASKHESEEFPNNCISWVDNFHKVKPKQNGAECYTLVAQSYAYPFTGIPRTEYKLRHVVIKVKLCNGNTLLLDNGWWSWLTGNPMERPNNVFPAFPQSTYPL
jgi:RHS repeat-associated protein